MRSFYVGAAAIFFAAASQAQVAPTPAQPPAKTTKAAITGVVLDSLHGTYLVGAEVMVEGSKTILHTDSLGRFRVDSLAPGTYQIGVFHPLLDTLGLTIATRPFHVGADSVSIVTLAIPSAPTIIERSCTARPFSQGNSAIVGQVVDPETLRPVPGAEVSVAWVELEVSKEIGVRRSPRVIRDSTDNLGRFSLCGLPTPMEASLQAQRGGSLTAQIPVVLGDSRMELFARTLLLSPVDSGAKVGQAVVSGRVILEGNPAGAGSRVELAGAGAVTTTNERGEFTLKNLPSGTHLLVARHLGYGADAVSVDLSAREPKTVTLMLPKYVTMMEPVLVTARRTAALERSGFTRRRKSGAGYFLGPDQLERMRPQHLTDILRQVPGLRVSYAPDGETVSSTRSAGSISGAETCVQYYVDDMPWHSAMPGDINLFVSGPEIVAVEVYQGAGPPQYSRGMQSCTSVVLWTRMRIRD